MRLSKPASFNLQASIVFFFLAGSSAPTPLYRVYRAVWGFSPITITIVFGIYALAVLASLLSVGSLSDYVGRRPVLLVATLLQAVTMLMFASATGVAGLIAARIVQGIATGAAMGAVGAGMLDIDHDKGTLAGAIGPLTGTATGSMLSGLMVQYLPAPTQFVYLLLFVVFVAQAVGVWYMPESSPRRHGAISSLRPRFELPPAAREAMLLAVPVLIATWGLVGFYGSLGPSIVRQLVSGQSHALGGLALFVLAGSGAGAVLSLHKRSARVLMIFGTATLIAGVAMVLLAITKLSVVLFFAGSAIAGMGFGTGFQAAIRSVVVHAAAHQRAGVLSVLYLVAYLAMGLPAVVAGVGVVHGGGLTATAIEYGLGVIALAALALLAALRARPMPSPERASEPRVVRASSPSR